MSVTYRQMACRDCGTMIAPTVEVAEAPKTVTRYSDCYYRCPNCGVAYSNAKSESHRRKIYSDLELNVPLEVRDGFKFVVSQALNVDNRENKVCKAAFETSEDAVTWTVFRYLQDSMQVATALSLKCSEPNQVLYWGVHWPQIPSMRLQAELIATLKEIRENPRRFTEPDVVLSTDNELVFVESKYTSGNVIQSGYPHFDRYLENSDGLFSVPHDTVKLKGFYELTRNWVIGNHLARRLDKQFLLLNLAPESCRDSATQFGKLIGASEKSYRFVTWNKLLAELPTSVPLWLTSYLANHPRLFQ